MRGSTGCCGYHFHERTPNLFGLMTLSMPLIALGGAALLLIKIISPVIPSLDRVGKQLIVITKANLKLVHAVTVYPKIRCRLAGMIFPYSPRISGIVYKNFNVMLFLLVWTAIISLIIAKNL